MSNCKITGCNSKIRAKGLCAKHWDSQYRENNREKVNEKARNWRQKNKHKLEKYRKHNESFFNKRKAWENKNKEKLKEYGKKFRAENQEKLKNYAKEYYLQNKEKLKKRARDYSKKNHVVVLTRRKEYRKRKPEVHRINGAKRRAAKLKRTVAWANLHVIKEFYKNCPPGYQVDHIIPLQGKNVSGLHVETNLQYLSKTENMKKGNRYENN